MSSTKIAEAFEAVADDIVTRRGVAPLKARSGVRHMFTTDKGRAISHGDLLKGLFKKAGIEAQVQDGRRPKAIPCPVCHKYQIVNNKGPIPVRCSRCAKIRPASARPKVIYCCDCGQKRKVSCKGVVPVRCRKCSLVAVGKKRRGKIRSWFTNNPEQRAKSVKRSKKWKQENKSRSLKAERDRRRKKALREGRVPHVARRHDLAGERLTIRELAELADVCWSTMRDRLQKMSVAEAVSLTARGPRGKRGGQHAQ